MKNRTKANITVYSQIACLGLLIYGPLIGYGTKKVTTKSAQLMKKGYRTAKWKIYDRNQMKKEVELLEKMWNA